MFASSMNVLEIFGLASKPLYTVDILKDLQDSRFTEKVIVKC